jgi:hypothetical protein
MQPMSLCSAAAKMSHSCAGRLSDWQGGMAKTGIVQKRKSTHCYFDYRIIVNSILLSTDLLSIYSPTDAEEPEF